MTRRRSLLWWIVAVACALLIAWWWFGRADVVSDQAAVSDATLRDPALIAKGAYLTTIADCAGCHTAQGAKPFAGGSAVATPFGDIPAPNITPDVETGLGSWNFNAFWQALHTGTGRHGEWLYPAFSYTSYTKVTNDDALAIFAYLRSLPAVHRPAMPLALKFPYSVRRNLGAWRALYFREGVYQPDSKRSPQWNRGAYLVQGLGHCNECHAPRDALGGTPKDKHLTGGEIPEQNWYAPDLSTQQNGGLHGWAAQDIVDLLKTGQSAKGAAFGPMADVVATSTQHMTDDDLHAIANYLQSLPPRKMASAEPELFDADAIAQQGEKIYLQHCADCHGKDGTGVTGVYPPLKGNSSVTEPTGVNAIRTVLLGGFAPSTAAYPRPYSMPPYAQQLNDSDVSAVVSYIRRGWSNHATAVKPEDVSRYRQTPID
ncbi:cytochrome c [Rhodanobacter sp. L36]|uniref:c-type cytochrome n=1 Tax=Rhodanobacter sp. L36 TaxID=1747221 RepID=UPI00131E04FA|nr:cytochrome c [Rhodanobacter sp. L36]